MKKKSEDVPSGVQRVAQAVETGLRKRVERRGFLKGLGVALGAAATSSACKSSPINFDKFFQKHYKELTPADKEKIFARIKAENQEKYGVATEVKDPQAQEGVKFVYTLSLSLCNGNRKCVEACVKENNQSRDPAIEYIRVIEMPRGSFNLEKGTADYEGKVPKKDKYYLPMQCNQCDNPPCVKACPVEATWKEKDGIVAIDYDWCIGCRYCMAACPYDARRFNYAEPSIPAKEINPNQSYLGNRPRPKGVVEKCHFCSHRTRVGQNPACMEACPTGARNFGNILDPNSEVSNIIKKKRVFVLKEELNTVPSFYYYFD